MANDFPRCYAHLSIMRQRSRFCFFCNFCDFWNVREAVDYLR